MPATGFQAFILCGPGESLTPFNSNPKDFPKAVIPIANRPMVWYPLDWCYRTGVTNIHLITPPDCTSALETALGTNPYLTSLPHPRPTVLSPNDLTLATGTAEIFRLKQVQDAITSDFIVLPCDIVSELPGSTLLETYMALQSSLGGANNGSHSLQPDRNGGLGVWYEVKDTIEAGAPGGVGVKKEGTDFLATVPFKESFSAPRTSELGAAVSSVVMTMPTDAMKDAMEDREGFKVRWSLMEAHGRVKMQMTKRDAHMYLLPLWVKEYMRRNETFDSMSEDALGWWAKSTWQRGLAEKLHMPEAIKASQSAQARRKSFVESEEEDSVDIASLSSTGVVRSRDQTRESHFASRVTEAKSAKAFDVPPLLSYVHPALNFLESTSSTATAGNKKGGAKSTNEPPAMSSIPLVRRLDTTALLLSGSLYLARLPALGQPGASPSLSHTSKVHSTSVLPQQATIDQRTVLIDANCTLAPRITIRESVIGSNVSIASGSRLTRCLVMPDTVIEEKCILTGCIIGRRCHVGKEADLKECRLQEGYRVSEKTSAKNETFAGFEEGDALMEGGGIDDDDFDFGS